MNTIIRFLFAAVNSIMKPSASDQRDISISQLEKKRDALMDKVSELLKVRDGAVLIIVVLSILLVIAYSRGASCL